MESGPFPCRESGRIALIFVGADLVSALRYPGQTQGLPLQVPRQQLATARAAKELTKGRTLFIVIVLYFRATSLSSFEMVAEDFIVWEVSAWTRKVVEVDRVQMMAEVGVCLLVQTSDIVASMRFGWSYRASD